jgi:hypothetical protein
MIFDPGLEGAWTHRVNRDPEFQLSSRWTELQFELIEGTRSRTYRISNSTFAPDESVGDRAGHLVLAGSAQAWEDFRRLVPPPHSNHVLAMDRRRDDFEIRSGREELIRHLQVVDVALQLMRPSENEGTAQ